MLQVIDLDEIHWEIVPPALSVILLHLLLQLHLWQVEIILISRTFEVFVRLELFLLTKRVDGKRQISYLRVTLLTGSILYEELHWQVCFLLSFLWTNVGEIQQDIQPKIITVCMISSRILGRFREYPNPE